MGTNEQFLGIRSRKLNNTLHALSRLVGSANKIPYFTGTRNAAFLDFHDDDTLAEDSATALVSEQAIKAYADDLATNLSAKFLHVREEQTSGTAGSTPAATTYETMVLNTVKTNDLSGDGVALASNQITGLPAGDYYFEAQVPVFTGTSGTAYGIRSKLYDVTGAADLFLGSTCRIASGENSWATASGRFTLSTASSIELRARVGISGGPTRWGTSTSQDTEVYSELKIWKVA